jgi:formylglycine-generating enzyme required for sulfatase activity
MPKAPAALSSSKIRNPCALAVWWALACASCGTDVYFGRACDGHGGSPMVDAGGYCIDRTEVSNAQYAAFLGAGPDVAMQSPDCAWNDHFERQDLTTEEVLPAFAPNEVDLPVANVDWCDAAAYCAWAGKRLCGKRGGGAVAFDARASTASEWFAACSRGGTRAYPYGDTFDVSACAVTGSYHAVGSDPRCAGGIDGVYDLIGNVWEWENSCGSDTASPGEAPCSRRGGAVAVDPSNWSCADGGQGVRRLRQADIGFRCCSD